MGQTQNDTDVTKMLCICDAIALILCNFHMNKAKDLKDLREYHNRVTCQNHPISAHIFLCHILDSTKSSTKAIEVQIFDPIEHFKPNKKYSKKELINSGEILNIELISNS